VRNFGNVRWMMCLWLALSVSCGSSGSDEVRPLQSTASTTTAAASTPPVSTVEPPATSTTAAPASTTTISPWTDEQLEVIAAFEAAEEAYRLARSDPEGPEPDSLSTTRTSEALERARLLLAERAEQGLATQFGTAIKEAVVYRDVSIAGDLAFVDGCEVDDAVIIESATSVVVDDAVVIYEWTVQLVRSRVGWEFDALEIRSAVEGPGSCLG